MRSDDGVVSAHDLRRDPLTGRCVLFATARDARPRDFPAGSGRPPDGSTGACPFCPGAEAETPPETLVVRRGGGAPNSPGWALRVVPNKFPALMGDLAQVRRATPDALSPAAAAYGVHEVVIETPEHDATLARMSVDAVDGVLWAWRQRLLVHRQNRRLHAAIVFRNQGAEAGASLAHPHSQIVVLPLTPPQLLTEITHARRYYRSTRRCLLCAVIAREIASGARIVARNRHAVALTPWASRFSYEMWVMPRRHSARYERMSDRERRGVAELLREACRRLGAALDRPAFNLQIVNLPFRARADAAYHWRIELLPRTSRVAGFELGSGVYINPTLPETAARRLRGRVS
jgi:UDPglucose--hexose-1-phosphate uridylyltransferase